MQPTIQDVAGNFMVFPYNHLSALRHLHTSYEIAVPRTGRIRVHLDDQDRMVEPGEVLVVFPGVAHSYDPDVSGEGMMLIFSDKMFSEPEGDWSETQPAEPVLRLDAQDRDVAYCLERLFEMTVPSQRNETLARIYLSLLFARMTPALRLQTPAHPGTKDLLYRAMQYMSQNLAAPLNLRGTARALGVNTYYLSHVLNGGLHMSFRVYLNALRIDRARRYLRVTSWSIEEIAAACGFANLRTFDRVFAERCNCTPRDFRKAALALRQERAGKGKE